MTNRNCFPTSLIALSISATLTLSGCLATIPNVPQQVKDLLPAALGGIAAITCYQNLGGGNARIVSGAACGAGTFFLVKSLSDKTDDKTAEGVKTEYQTALTARPDGPPFDYKIQYQNKAGKTVVIMLHVLNIENSSPSTQCRSFRETITDAGVAAPATNRRACRDNGGPWAMLT